MIMQRDKFEGAPVAIYGGERYEDRMRRMRGDMLRFAAIRAGADSPWFALRVMTGREQAVEKSLTDAGVEALVPKRKGPELRRRHRVIPAQVMPVICGYVLVRCDQSAEAIVGLRGVEHAIDLLGGSLSPYRIPHAIVSHFNELSETGVYDWEKPAGLFKRGMRVAIKDGPFASLSGVIVSCRADGKGDAVVEVQILGGLVPVLVPLAILSPM